LINRSELFGHLTFADVFMIRPHFMQIISAHAFIFQFGKELRHMDAIKLKQSIKSENRDVALVVLDLVYIDICRFPYLVAADAKSSAVIVKFTGKSLTKIYFSEVEFHVHRFYDKRAKTFVFT
jgi:hypothetical protein